MTSGSASTPILITHSADLLALVETLCREPILAVDTESNSLFAYRERVCLIQISTTQEDYLIDPIALQDLSPLAPLFCHPTVEKVFHAAEYDVLCLKRDFGFGFINLFDTMAAARILGWKEVGLGALLETEFGVRQDKRHQRANWGQRPLPPDLLEYACMDTHYLIPLRHRLYEHLVQRDLLQLANEDFSRLSAINPNGNQALENRSVNPWRISGAHDLKPRQAAVLLELCRYRDQIARSLDRPLFKVINDRTLLAIAAKTPQNLEDLRQLPSMSALLINRHGNHLIRAVQCGLKARPLYPPRPTHLDDGLNYRLEALRSWRKRTAQKMGVSSEVVLPRDLVFTLAERNPHNLEELADAMSEVPWRKEHFGEQIMEVLIHAARR